jgi:hypothetical protein
LNPNSFSAVSQRLVVYRHILPSLLKLTTHDRVSWQVRDSNIAEAIAVTWCKESQFTFSNIATPATRIDQLKPTHNHTLTVLNVGPTGPEHGGSIAEPSSMRIVCWG